MDCTNEPKSYGSIERIKSSFWSKNSFGPGAITPTFYGFVDTAVYGIIFA